MKFGVSIFPQVNWKLDSIVSFPWRARSSNLRMAAKKYQMSADACFWAVVNNSSLIGLGDT